MGVGDMLAIPSKEIIHFPNDSHSNMQCIPDFIYGNIPTIKIQFSEIEAGLIDRKSREILRTIQTLRRVFGVSG
jgi:hypothetical protein